MINAQHLRDLRLDRGLSQRKLAASAGVDALTIKRLEAGGDAGDLSLRVLGKIADTLGVHPAALLEADSEPEGEANRGLHTVGSALANGGRSTRTGLARAAGLAPCEVDDTIGRLANRLAPLGIAVARHGEEAWLAPATATALTGERHRPLDVNQARLFRRIHRGEDVRRSLTHAERTMTLPSLLRLGLVETTAAGLVVRATAARSLHVQSQPPR